jgi:hypothetical protein
MTKKLSELFDLSPDIMESLSMPIPDDAEIITAGALTNLEKIENALPQVRGLESSDIELDEIANMAINSYKDLSDLGMQVDSRFSSEIFGVAATMLGHALTAKTAKLTKKIKMIELQLKKAALDQKANANVEELEATPLGDVKSLDRNELLKMLAVKSSAE